MKKLIINYSKPSPMRKTNLLLVCITLCTTIAFAQTTKVGIKIIPELTVQASKAWYDDDIDYKFNYLSISTGAQFVQTFTKVIGVETGTASEDFINRRLEIDAPGLPPVQYKLEPGEVRTFPDSMMPFDDLRLGNGVRLDAVIAPEQTAKNAVRNDYPVRILEDVYPFRSPAVVIADKGDPEWTAKVGSIIAEMKKDGTLATLTTKWYGKDYSAD